MAAQSPFRKSLLKGGIYTGLLSVLFVIKTSGVDPAPDIFMALPFFVSLYFLLFTMGRPEVSDWLSHKIKGELRVLFLCPLLLALVYFGYIGMHDQNPLQDTLLLVPYLLFFPVLVFAAKRYTGEKPDWLDFATFLLFFLPVTVIDASPPGNLPVNGGGFDSVYRISVMLIAIFSFVTIRNIREVGFYPVFKWKSVFTTLWVWLVFYVFVFVIAYLVNFIKLKDDHTFHFVISAGVFWKFLSVFLHTALFEELVFRGLLQNMLAKRIAWSGGWKVWLLTGLLALTAMSLVVGYTMNGNLKWFPAVVTVLLFAAAFGLEIKSGARVGTYTALAVTSVVFGLAHAHAGSVIFVGLAAIGGWAYGYVYYKTKNVFYAALLHALVNTTPLIFGLELAK
ncbi:MAG: CPBP family intramembrane metalloprotease [Chitinophagaceae bacterium]|nr:CPBP family intramembrane metalloprotease [Chitinophagaceae bacterium]